MRSIKVYRVMTPVSERNIRENVTPIVLQLEEVGEHIAYLHAETDDDGQKKIRGIIELEKKKYECVLSHDSFPESSALLIMPLDDGSYNNMNVSERTDREA
ncbi:MAG: hypothetical protein HY617_01310 [Candidatus Sungbacteria bacterium]|nr:hypothetical protein [Candidatus Sungbacteria bacterium]